MTDAERAAGDIVERLRRSTELGQCSMDSPIAGPCERCLLAHEAADEIAKLRVAIRYHDREIARLRTTPQDETSEDVRAAIVEEFDLHANDAERALMFGENSADPKRRADRILALRSAPPEGQASEEELALLEEVAVHLSSFNHVNPRHLYGGMIGDLRTLASRLSSPPEVEPVGSPEPCQYLIISPHVGPMGMTDSPRDIDEPGVTFRLLTIDEAERVTLCMDEYPCTGCPYCSVERVGGAPPTEKNDG